MTVTVNALPVVNAGEDFSIPNGTSTTLDATVTGADTYSWTPASSLLDATVEDPETVNLSVTTTFVLTATLSATGCSNTDDIQVTITGSALSSTATATPSTICAGSASQLGAGASGGSGSYSYSWTSSPAGFTSTISNPTVTPAVTTTYYVEVDDGYSTVNSQVTVTVNAIPAAPTAGSNSPVCEGTALNLTASTISGATYSWTGPNGFTSTLQNPTIASATTAATGLYSVIATVSGCASSAGTVNVTVNAIPAAPTAGSNSPVCAGSTLNLTASTISGATYSWTGPNGFTSTLQNPTIADVTTAAAGQYNVTATVNGCTSVAGSVTVTVNTKVTPTFTQLGPYCSGVTPGILPTTSNNGITGTWSPATINTTITGPTVYTFTPTAGLCATTATMTVTVNALPVVNAGEDISIPNGTSTTLNATVTGADTYSWTPASSLVDATVEDPTTVNLSVTTTFVLTATLSATGCSNTDDVKVTITGSALNATATATPSTICSGSTTQLGAGASGGSGSYSYSWTSDPAGFTSTLSNPTVTPAVTTTYYVEVDDGYSTVNSQVTVTVNPIPAAPAAGSNSPVCEGTTLNLTATMISGATYSWTGPNGFTSTLQNPTIASATTAAAGQYNVTATVNGCTSVAGSVTVTVNSLPLPVITGPSTACTSSSGNVYTTTAGMSDYTWTISAGGSITAGGGTTSNSVTVTWNSTGAQSVSVNYTNINGCRAATPTVYTVTVNDCFKTLNLSSVLLEGLYDGSGTMRQAWNESGPQWPAGIADKIIVELHDAANYSNIIYTDANISLSTTGTAVVTIPAIYNGSYYVTIKHRNSLETTTVTSISFAGGIINQSFGARSNIYGGNLSLSYDGRYLIYSGDVNQDGFIDTQDYIGIDNDSYNYVAGYLDTDVDGSGIIDTNDYIPIDNNNYNYIGTVLP